MSCAKIGYPDLKTAQGYAKNVNHRLKHGASVTGRNKQRPYQCNRCGKWHLTSLSKAREKHNRRVWKSATEKAKRLSENENGARLAP